MWLSVKLGLTFTGTKRLWKNKRRLSGYKLRGRNNIVCRLSFPEIYEVLDAENDERLRGIFHCFTGNEQDVQKILGYKGFSFGIGGVVTYKKSDLPETLKYVPLDKLLIETDAPYLAPAPFRGKRNESSYVIHTAEKIAEILEQTSNELEEITTRNAMNLFHPEY